MNEIEQWTLNSPSIPVSHPIPVSSALCDNSLEGQAGLLWGVTSKPATYHRDCKNIGLYEHQSICMRPDSSNIGACPCVREPEPREGGLEKVAAARRKLGVPERQRVVEGGQSFFPLSPAAGRGNEFLHKFL